MWLSVLCPHTCIHAHTLSRVQAKKVREITISEAVSGNSGLVGEGDKDGVRETDSSDMGLNKLIESVSQAMQGMEGTAGRKGARGKTGKKKKRSGDNGSCPAMSTDGGSAPSRDSGGVSASGIGVGDGGGGGGDGKGGEGCGDYDAHFPFAPAPAAGTGREGGRIAERKRASDDRLSFIAAAAESVLLSPGVKSRDWSRGQMDNRVGGGGRGRGRGRCVAQARCSFWHRPSLLLLPALTRRLTVLISMAVCLGTRQRLHPLLLSLLRRRPAAMRQRCPRSSLSSCATALVYVREGSTLERRQLLQRLAKAVTVQMEASKAVTKVVTVQMEAVTVYLNTVTSPSHSSAHPRGLPVHSLPPGLPVLNVTLQTVQVEASRLGQCFKALIKMIV